MSELTPLTLDQAAEALTFVSAEEYYTWLNIGNALFTEFGEAGWPVWEAWSQQSERYQPREAVSTWRSLNAGKVSIGYLIAAATRAGWRMARREMSPEERRRVKAEQEARRRAAAEAVERDQARLARMQSVVARACQTVLEQHLTGEDDSGYLRRKGVGAHGVLFPKRTVLISIDSERERADVWAGTEVRDWFRDLPRPRPDHLHMFKLSPGDLVVPMRDVQGSLWALQAIHENGKKLFPRFGRKASNFHVLERGREAPYVGIAEGYATAASVHEAMGWPVVVAMDAGNMARVLPLVTLLYPGSQVVILGDDDTETPGNPGRRAAEDLARRVGCIAAFPRLEVA